LIEITPNLLSEIEHYAALMFSRSEIAIILELDPGDFDKLLHNKDGDPFKSFQKGRLKKEAMIRKSIFELAENGSSPAQSFAIKLIENAKMDDL
jgi:hypothetical protein